MLDAILREHVVVPVDGPSSMGAYLARPAAPGWYPAVIVGMELFGVTQYIRNVADRVAELGYLAIAPDFYHRAEGGVELTYDQAGRTKGFELLHALRRAHTLQDVRAMMHFLTRRTDVRGRIGFLGLSVGGHIAYLAATQLDIAACASFYGGWLTTTDIPLSQPEPTLSLTAGIAHHGGRMVFFVGENDVLITAAQREDIGGALAEANVRHELIVYPHVQHGFFCDERDTFDQAASDDAWERTKQLFAAELHR